MRRLPFVTRAGVIANIGGAAVRGPVYHPLGLLATTMGHPAAAARHFAAATQAAGSAGAPRLRQRTPAESPQSVAPEASNVFRRDGDYWTIRHRSVEFRLRDSKGLRDMAELLARQGTSIAALDLAISLGERRRASQDGLHLPSYTGEVLDATARAAYRRRLQDLELEADDDAMGDDERSARLATEQEAVVSALTTAYGLGGRARRMGSPAERAGTAVTTRIRDAIRRIGRSDPDLGEHLSRSVRTGIFRYPDHDEVYQAGDAYYGSPGHLPLMFTGTELIEFSPT